ncbi:DUF4912 domain-containing protein [Bacillus songklensis]|uniref:DUF4912 domain-containing protein n=1 Tax=Bacillus songklensis TaxID=1069116 RepID=A0ABV8B151_9BACI
MTLEKLDIDLCKAIRWNDSCLYVHWNISSLSRQLFEECFLCKWKEMTQYVIVYDVTNIMFNGHNAHKWRRYGIKQEEQHMFLYLPVNKSYIVDIAVQLKTSYYTILRSNLVHLSHNEINEEDCIDQIFSEWQLNRPAPPEWSQIFSAYSCYEKT